jgi:PilZ domain
MEQRAARRRRVLKGGSIEFDGTRVECVVRNISELGAGIEVESPAGIPHEISLRLLSQHESQRGYIVWRKERRLGVKFVTSACW